MIYLDYELARILRERLQRSMTGYADWGRYTAKLNDDKKTFTVWAYVGNTARKIGEAPLAAPVR